MPFKWMEECQKAFDNIKHALISPDIMAFPPDNGKFIPNTDASDETIGAVLTQIQAGEEKVISYDSQMVGKSERNYCVTDQELLTVKYFMEYYKHYLLGQHFRVHSDHEALKWLLYLKEPKHRIVRWIEVLSKFDFEAEYQPGKKHGNSEALSRYPSPRDLSCPPAENELPYKSCMKCLK